jgi:hypothetical protein
MAGGGPLAAILTKPYPFILGTVIVLLASHFRAAPREELPADLSTFFGLRNLHAQLSSGITPEAPAPRELFRADAAAQATVYRARGIAQNRNRFQVWLVPIP